MCKDCGCEEAGKRHATHRHADGTVHTHSHEAADHDHGVATRTVTVEQRVLAHNDELAAQNRAWLKARGIVALNLISSPGTGKTLLLEKTVERLKARIGVAVITGDQQTDNDKVRIARTGVPVEQIETHDACHLDAARIAKVLPLVVRPEKLLM